MSSRPRQASPPEPRALDGPPERGRTRDVAVVVGALAVVAASAWAYLILGAGVPMAGMGAAMAPMALTWTPAYAATIFVMWSVMMLAMMLPAAGPMVLAFAAMDRRRRAREASPEATPLFVAGYVVVWTGFAALAVTLQYALSQAALLSPTMATTSRTAAGAVLVGAGLYQWTPLKQACLRWCRSPLDFLLRHWRPGRKGAFRLGLRHGAYCLGCCWAAMLLLFVGGVMNLLWVAGLTVLVLAEKTAPAGRWVSRGAGAALVVWGLVTLLSPGAPGPEPMAM